MNRNTIALFLVVLTISACMVAPTVQPGGPKGEVLQSAELPTDQAIEMYLSGRELDPVEGVWTHDELTFEVVIVKNSFGIEADYDYVGIITWVEPGLWNRGEVKFLLQGAKADEAFTGAWLTNDKTRQSMDFAVENKNMLQARFTSSDGEDFFVRVRRKNTLPPAIHRMMARLQGNPNDPGLYPLPGRLQISTR